MKPSADDQTTRTKARRRALRAAQVVTLGLALAGAGGCYAKHGAPTPMAAAGEDGGGASDAGATLSDAVALVDTGDVLGADAQVTGDADVEDVGDGALADAGLCDLGGDPAEYAACCQAHGWDWDWGCMAWGPYVPPGDGALGAPRATNRIG